MDNIFITFPKYFRNSIAKISSDGFIGIITFWTHQNIIIKQIEKLPLDIKNKILVIGNLYTYEGFKYVILNSFLCQQMQYLIFVGYDKNNVYDNLMKFHNNNYYENISNEYQNIFWNYFKDSHFKINLDELDNTLNKCTNKYNWILKSIDIPFSQQLIDSKQSEKIGFVVRDSNLENLWKRILTKIKLFGVNKESDNDTSQKELLGIVSILTSSPIIFDSMPNKDLLDSYIPQVITDKKDINLEYTYGTRLYRHNQIENLIEELKQNKYSRRALALTYSSKKDSTSKNPPCLILINFSIQLNMLYMSCYFRSQDMMNAYCLNIYALSQLHQQINKILLTQLGDLCIFTNSAHVYERDFNKLNMMNNLDCQLDKRGYFIIKINDNKIEINLYDLKNRLIKKFDGMSENILDELQPYISEISHALYIGKEVMRAKYCLENKIEYLQN